jgi:hypothetical protein
MAFVWVQQWVALPVIYEGPMGDLPTGSRPQALDSAATGFARDENQNLPASSLSPYKSPDNTTPFYSQLSAIPQNHLRPDFRSSTHPTAQYPPQDHGQTSLNMGSMSGALPDYNSVDDASVNPQSLQSVPRSLPGPSTSGVAYQLGQMPAPGSGSLPNHPPYGNAYAAGPYQQQHAFNQGSQHTAYPPFATNQPRMPGGNSIQPAFQNYMQPSQYMYYSTPYGPQGQYNPGYPAQGAQGHTMYERRGSMAGASVGIGSPHSMDFQHHDGGFAGARMGLGGLQGDQAAVGSVFSSPFARVQGKITQSMYQDR